MLFEQYKEVGFDIFETIDEEMSGIQHDIIILNNNFFKQAEKLPPLLYIKIENQWVGFYMHNHELYFEQNNIVSNKLKNKLKYFYKINKIIIEKYWIDFPLNALKDIIIRI